MSPNCSPSFRSILSNKEYHKAYYQANKDKMKAYASARVSNYRRSVRAKLIAEAGGKCVKCGYDKCVTALHFDHLGEEEKIDAVSILIRNGRYKQARVEALKCQLLCANCHAEVTEERRASLA